MALWFSGTNIPSAERWTMIKNFMERLESVINLVPPVPVVALELLKVLDNPGVDLNMLSRVISTDPSMSVNVLKVANSAFYRLPYQVKTIDYAVRILGVKEIAVICVACGVYNALTQGRTPPGFDYRGFWKHSVATGVIARRLARELNMGNQSIIYLCGLLHDIGKIILHRVAHDIYAEAATATATMSILEAERQLLGESHDVVGDLIMEKWKLPREFTNVARYHHIPMKAPEECDRHSVALQHLSDRLAKLRYVFCSDIPEGPAASTEAFNILARKNPRLADLDLEEFAWAPEGTENEIIEMQSILTGSYSGN
jgi:putative nucleotidyltransferase with HDIG domain